MKNFDDDDYKYGFSSYDDYSDSYDNDDNNHRNDDSIITVTKMIVVSGECHPCNQSLHNYQSVCITVPLTRVA
jgi:hypothetical protein